MVCQVGKGKLSGPMKLKPQEGVEGLASWFDVSLDHVADGVITVDEQGRVAFMNAAARTMCAWDVDEARGLPIEDVLRLVNEDTRAPVESCVKEALRDGTAAKSEPHRLLIAKDGVERPISSNAAPVHDKDAAIIGAVFVFRDVSEHRFTEQVAKRALWYSEKIIATLREPFVVLDDKLHVQSANEAFYSKFRVSKEETEGRFIYDLGNGQWNIPGLRSLLQEVLEKSSVRDYEVEHDFPSIGSKIMLLNSTRFESAAGEKGMVLLSFEDVTEDKRADVKIQASEIRYRRLFQTAKDGIVILDMQTQKIMDSNPFMTELLEYSHEEIVGKELWQLGFFRDKSAAQVAYKELEMSSYIRYDHLPLETKNGDTAEVEFVGNVYHVDGKKVAQCNIRDISERSRLERKTMDQAAALADLHRRKDEFLAMLSHELRNPLAPILNAVLLLRLQGRENPTQQQAVAIIERQVGQLRHIVDDLLEVSRITSGRVQLRREVVTIGGILTHAVETARPLIKQHKHELTVSIPVEPIHLNADAARLEQVVVNLLTNAVKYTEEGGHIWLSVAEESNECVVRVRDDGEGIAPEVLPRIFDLFTQGERSLDRSQGGLGIGLALAQQLVEMHGGRVEAHSETGRGSEFIVRLPLVPAPLQSADSQDLQIAVPLLKSLRVLVVEDNVDTARSLTLLLEASGHRVRNAYDGTSALEEALDFRPNVVLLDIGLPGLDGYKVAKWMRHTLRDVMLVAVTGYGRDADRERSREAGFDHHLVKPADFSDVLSILATVSDKAM